MQAQSDKVAQRARRRAVQASIRSFQDWIVQESSLGAVHRSLRVVPQAADELVVDGVRLFHPVDIVDAKVKQYQTLWAPDKYDPQELEEVFSIAREAAR
eukprot:4908397-Pyramimonas_sp.AAC.1